MYSLYVRPRYFKFKRKYQQCGSFPDSVSYLSCFLSFLSLSYNYDFLWEFQFQCFQISRRELVPITRIFYKQIYFQVSLSVASLFNEWKFKCYLRCCFTNIGITSFRMVSIWGPLAVDQKFLDSVNFSKV